MGEDNFYKTERITIPAAEEILGKEFPVLDKGYVRLVDYMGGDDSIVQAARTSYGKGTKKVSEDKGLIRYLMRHRHTTPFEMVEMKFHVKVPMDAWRQWIRHRTANVNEYSTRYSIAIDEKQETFPGSWRSQSKDNKQGSSGFLEIDIGKNLSLKEKNLHELAQEVYQERIDSGVAKEQARKDLPLSTYTVAYWKIDLHNLFSFLGLRMDPHAQLEIREYANVMGNEIASRVVPIAWEAFKDYRLDSMNLSGLERKGLVRVIKGEDLKEVAENIFTNKRERKEFLEKMPLLLGETK